MNKIKEFIGNLHALRTGLCMCALAGAVSLQAQEAAKAAPAAAASNENLVTVQGKVIDAATKKPIIGARVQMVDRLYSAMTNENGVYTLKVPSLGAVVEVTAEDYATREVGLRGENQADIQLYSTTFTGLYENVETLTGQRSSASMITPYAQIAGSSNDGAITVDQEIAAKLTGQVRALSHSGVPGNGVSMFIRGLNSINAQATPLILVDGVVFDNHVDRHSIMEGYFDNPLASIDMNDVANITILKDGTALYGSRGANGVILITTKRGRSQATQIEVNAYTGFNEKPKLPEMMNAEQFRRYASNLVIDDPNYSDYESVTWLKNTELIYRDGRPTNMQQYKSFTNETDWADEVYRNTFLQSYSIAVNGGDESALYNLSVGYTNSPSTLKNSSFSRLNARFNSDIQMFSRLAMAVDISYSQTDRTAPNDGAPADYTTDPVTSVGYLSLIKAPFLSPYQYTRDGYLSSNYSDADVFGLSNPTALLDEDNNRYKNEANHVNITATPKLDIGYGLELSSKFSYTLDKTVEAYFRPRLGSPDFDRGTGTLASSTVKSLSAKQISIFSDTRLNWKKSFGQHNLDLLLGYRYTYDQYQSDWVRADNTANDHINTITASLPNRVADGVDDRVKTAALYFNADYNWLNRYFLTGTLSFDTSTRFGSEVDGAVHMGDHSWGFFPSIQGGWIISNEPFMKNVDFLSFARLRAGYSITGNDQILNYAYKTYFSPFFYYNQTSGLQLANIGNETLGWERNHKFSVGLDASVFDDIFSFSVDFYKNHITDLLSQVQMPEVSGMSSYYWTNNGTMDNTGVEVSARVKLLNLRDFKWELGASISHYKNEVTALNGGKSVVNSYYGGEIITQEGSPAGLFYGYETVKRGDDTWVFATSEEAHSATQNSVDGSGRLAIEDEAGHPTYFEAGDVFFVDQNGDGVIDEQDRTVIGDPNPDFMGNITTRFQWKRFTLDALFTYSCGNDVYNYLRRQLESGSTYYNQTTAMNSAWSYEGHVTSMPRVTYDDPMGNSRFSDRWIEDGSYFRLKTLSLSYDIPINSSFLQGITVWASANNLWTATKYLGSDPEFSNSGAVLYQGVDSGLLSQGRSYYLGVKLNL